MRDGGGGGGDGIVKNAKNPLTVRLVVLTVSLNESDAIQSKWTECVILPS